MKKTLIFGIGSTEQKIYNEIKSFKGESYPEIKARPPNYTKIGAKTIRKPLKKVKYCKKIV